MCLSVKIWTTKNIAKKDIPCFKILKTYNGVDFCSPYQDYPYKFGQVTSVPDLDVPLYSNFLTSVVNRGLHTFAHHDDVHKFSYERFRFRRGGIYQIFEAVIPEGSEYYTGRFSGRKGYASNKLIVLEKICN